MASSQGVLVEGLLLLDPPYWTTLFERVDELEVRHCGIVARRTSALSHGLVDRTALTLTVTLTLTLILTPTLTLTP